MQAMPLLTVRKLESILEFVGFCNKFIAGFAAIAQPLYELLRNSAKGKGKDVISIQFLFF